MDLLVRQFHTLGRTHQLEVLRLDALGDQVASPARVLLLAYRPGGAGTLRSHLGHQLLPHVQMPERLGDDCLDLDPVGREQSPGQGVLVVHLVGGIGVYKHPGRPGTVGEHLEPPLVANAGKHRHKAPFAVSPSELASELGTHNLHPNLSGSNSVR